MIVSANQWHAQFPTARVYIGGIATTLIPDYFKEKVPFAEIIEGYHSEAEQYVPDYSILLTHIPEINECQIIHTTRGCIRSCPWCGVYKIEPERTHKPIDQIKSELLQNTDRKDVLIYDNSFLSHPYIEQVLCMLIELHEQYKFKFSACQGIDDRLLKKHEDNGIPIAQLMKRAGFYEIRFSYDHEAQRESMYYAVSKFMEAGYSKDKIQIFVIINHNEPPEVIEKRYFELYQAGLQIHSDRYRPLDSTYDNFHKGNTDYYIHTESGWTNMHVRGLLALHRDLNYSVRHHSLYCIVTQLHKSKSMNKGKSSQKIDKYNNL